ncbi:MAG TPA: polysaccharide biosynthesis C-terminal domain-containing protein [Terracidiphilus sp.]|nr:polysaccharide biosynthesis C-terminal domain-containing protein [Terracidiphilus sp.]
MRRKTSSAGEGFPLMGDASQRPGTETRLSDPQARLAVLAKNSVANLLRMGTSWIIVLVVPPLLIRLLDRASYATWMLVLQIGAYATIFDGGLQLAIGRFVARAEHAADRNYLGTVLSSSTVFLGMVAAAVCVLAATVAFHLGSLFHSIPAPIVPQARAALLLVGGSLGLAMSTSAFAGLCLGLEKNEINAAAVSVSKLAGAGGTLWAAFHHEGLMCMALWTAAGTLMQPVIFYFATRLHGAAAHFKLRLVRLAMVRQFARFCGATFASQLSSLLISGLDLPIVAAFDFRNAGYYALAATASNLLSVPHGAVLFTLVPMMSSRSAGEDAQRMGQALVRTSRLATALLLLAAIPFMLGMPVLLHLWVGPEYAQHALEFAEILMGAQLVRLTLLPYCVIGFSAGEQSRMLVSPTVEAAVNVACSLILVRFIGAEGVAVGTLVGAFVGVALHFLVSMRQTRSMAFNRAQLLWQGILRPVAWAAVPAGALALCLHWFTDPAIQIALLAASAAALAAVFWYGHLDAGERNVIHGAGTHLLAARFRPSAIGV